MPCIGINRAYLSRLWVSQNFKETKWLPLRKHKPLPTPYKVQSTSFATSSSAAIFHTSKSVIISLFLKRIGMRTSVRYNSQPTTKAYSEYIQYTKSITGHIHETLVLVGILFSRVYYSAHNKGF